MKELEEIRQDVEKLKEEINRYKILVGEFDQLFPQDIASRVDMLAVQYVWKEFTRSPFSIRRLCHLERFFETMEKGRDPNRDVCCKCGDGAKEAFLDLPEMERFRTKNRFLSVMGLHHDIIIHIQNAKKAWTDVKQTGVHDIQTLIAFYLIHDPCVAKSLKILVEIYNELIRRANIPMSEVFMPIFHR